MAAAPDPGVTKPERGEEMEVGLVRPAIMDRDSDQDVIRCGLGIFGNNIPIAEAIEYAGVGKFEFMC